MRLAPSRSRRSVHLGIYTIGLYAVLASLVLLPAAGSFAAESAAANTQGTPVASPPASLEEFEGSVLMRALRAELERSRTMQLAGEPAPYYVAYAVFDVQVLEVIGEFGGIVQDEASRRRLLRVDLRIGSPEFDNGNTSSGGFFAASLPLDEDSLALRQDIWWATDRAYRGAVEALAEKRADESSTSDPDRVADFSAHPGETTFKAAEAELPDRAMLRSLAERLSARMRGASHVFEGGVRLRAVRIERTFVSSDGDLAYEPALFLQWAAIARTQAEDGMNLVHYDGDITRSFEQLPEVAELEARTDRVLQELAQLREAPSASAYVGPVIFEADAAPALIRRLILPHLTGTPAASGDGVRESEPAAAATGETSIFARRLGKRVAPNWLSVYDDPTARDTSQRSRTGSQSLPWPGTYAFDDEGTRPRRTPLIEDGRLAGFLMSRTPALGFPTTTGHGRGGLLNPRALPGNVFVRAQRRRTKRALYADALKEAAAAGEEFMVVVRRIDDPAITAAYRGVDFRGGSSDPLLYAVRVYADGREEPVRGLSLTTKNPRSLRDLLATGREITAYGYYASDYDSSGGYWDAFPFYAVGASIHTPSLLFEEMELAPAANLRTPPPSIPSPMSQQDEAE